MSAQRLRVAPLVPHAGTMCLLDDVVRFDADEILCVTRSHRSPDNPLRDRGRLAALHAAEYGAQAMAAHGALVARSRAGMMAGGEIEPRRDDVRGGMLVSIRDLVLRVECLDTLPGELLVRARRLVADASSQIYDFSVTTEDGAEVATGRVAVILEPPRDAHA